MTARHVFTIIGLAALCVLPAAGQQRTDPEVLFQSALYKEQVELQLDQAIAGYKSVVSAAGASRNIAAKALLQMAGCYDRLGRPDAKATYELIVSEYATSGAVANAARVRMAALEQKGGEAAPTKLWDTDPFQFVQPDRVSRDGGYLTFLDNHNDIGIRDLSSGRQRMLTTKGTVTESFGGLSVPSPDGRLIAYNWWDSDSKVDELRVVGRDGGTPRVVETSDAVPVGWSPDSKFILVSKNSRGDARNRSSDLVLIAPDGSSSRLVKRFERRGEWDMEMSPDGRFLAYSRPSVAGKLERDLFSLSLDSGREVALLRHEADDYVLGWLPNSGGQLLFASDRDGTYGIWSTRVVDGRAQGEPMSVRPNTGKVWGRGFTKQGEFYYTSTVGRREVYIAALDKVTGRLVGDLTRVEGRYNGGMTGAVWSTDGDRLAYLQVMYPSSQLGPGGVPQNEDNRLAIQTMATGEVRLVPLRSGEGAPMWATDGRSVTVPHTRPDGREELILLNIETSARTTIADRDPASEDSFRSNLLLSPDGRRVFFQVRRLLPAWKNPAVISVRDLISGAEQPVTTEPDNYLHMWLSPDGKWLAVTRPPRTPDRPKLFIVPATGGEPRQLATELNTWSIADWVSWSADGRFLFVVKETRDKPWEIWQVPADGRAPRYTGISSPRQFGRIAAHPDGQRLAISQAGNLTEIWVLKKVPVLREK